ncbi:MAG: 9-O-acetylesterase [Alphaproteobacteria bacterium]|nr:9-O-acetylesterase [Alphaproteobacteria bacterium]
MRTGLKILFLFSFLAVTISAGAIIRMPVIFQNNMVLQRDKEVAIWGFGSAGEKVTVIFRELKIQTTTDENRRWLIHLPSQKAGGPYEISIYGESNVIELKNILFGDVWICGGQSNMQFSLDQIGYVPQDTAAISQSSIRIFTAHIGMDYIPVDDLKGGVWKQATAATIRNFSATGYFFGKFLYDRLKVPIGLISNNLGATSIETWMSRDALAQFPQFDEFVRKYLAPGKSAREVEDNFTSIKSEWEKKYYLTGKGLEERWYLPETDTTGWKQIEVPGWWENQGLADFDGVVWFRRQFDLPPTFTGDTLFLPLNQIDDYDITWVNGQKVGEGYGNQTWRRYKVPAGILKPKGNTLVVRVLDAGGRGGMYTHAIWWEPYLVGTWSYRTDCSIDVTKFLKPHVVNMSPFSTPAVLYNANIAPLTPLAIKGFIWYQGESNAARSVEYGQLFPAMILDWRSKFGQGDLPFLFVQLANHHPESDVPSESTWAELREAQAGALRLKNTGMAVTIDIGDAYDIHPRNKMEVGRRLGLLALNIAYGRQLVCSGPTFSKAEVRSDRVILHFNHENSLVSKDKYGYVRGFAVAGNDREFHWAKAMIHQGDLIIASENVKEPVVVRYLWSDNPGSIDLYNKEGLPVAPFRSDDWPLSTAGRVYSENPWEQN